MFVKLHSAFCSIVNVKVTILWHAEFLFSTTLLSMIRHRQEQSAYVLGLLAKNWSVRFGTYLIYLFHHSLNVLKFTERKKNNNNNKQKKTQQQHCDKNLTLCFL